MLLRRLFYSTLLCITVAGCNSVKTVETTKTRETPPPTPSVSAPETGVSTPEIALVPFNPSAETMVAVSPVIFTGIVTGLRYGYHQNSKMPFTFVTFTGVDYLRKDSQVATEKGNTVEISVAGGIRDNLRIMEVDELPNFELGQRYLVFLRGGGWRFSPITAFEGGVFRLHGRLKDDAAILNYQGAPIAEIKQGMFVTAMRDTGKEDGERDAGANERALNPALEKRLRNLSEKATNRSIRERQEAVLRKRDAKEEKQRIRKERDVKQGPLAGYDKVLRLSQLKSFVDRTAKATAEKYRAFSTLHLTPVGFNKEGFRIQSPQQQ